jgi:hypothetical protein
MPRPVEENWPVLAVSWSLGSVSPQSQVSKFLMVSYDDVEAIQFFGRFLLGHFPPSHFAEILLAIYQELLFLPTGTCIIRQWKI